MATATQQAISTSVASIIEVSASSHDSFEHAVASGEIQEYRVHLKVVFEPS